MVLLSYVILFNTTRSPRLDVVPLEHRRRCVHEWRLCKRPVR